MNRHRSCRAAEHTKELLWSSSQQLLEDVETPLSWVLMDHLGLLQQVWKDKERRES